MTDESMRGKFFDLWSGRLQPAEAETLRRTISSDAALEKAYAEDIALFESLRELKEIRIEVPDEFARQVGDRIGKRGFLSLVWRKVMNMVRTSGWLAVLGTLVAGGAIIGYAGLSSVTHESELVRSGIDFFLGGKGAILMVILAAYAIAAIPARAYRLSAAAVTAALALFMVRTGTQTFFGTDELMIDEAPAVEPSSRPSSATNEPSRRDRVEVVEREAPVSPELIYGPKKGKESALGASAAAPAGEIEALEGRTADVFKHIQGSMQDVIALPENRETYGAYAENPRRSVRDEPVSTFSIDVDTGSYSNIRRFLRLGQLPPESAVRIEELVNYFPYAYDSPTDQPFAVQYEIAPSPLSKGRYLMKVGIKARTAAQDRSKGWNLVFLVDTSGSMSDADKLPLVKQSLKLLVNSMRPEDRIALVTYAGTAGLVLPSTSGTEKAKINSAIESLDSAGSTNGEAGIDVAYAQAEANKIAGSVNRVILATDGDFNVGISDFNGLVNLIEKKRRSGITLTTLGFGTGNYQEQNMEQLADKGNGNYFYIDSFAEAKKVLSSELTQTMEVVAKDVKLQLEFNPAQVKEYRLIGFDNRMLNREDFTNDRIDAGEVGSGHTVTALYELELASKPAPNGMPELRYRQEEPAASPLPVLGGELGFLKIRAKAPEGDKSAEYSFPVASSSVQNDLQKATDDFRFAAAVAGFGEMLRESKYLGDFNWSDIRTLAEHARGDDPFGYRSEFLSLVDAAKAIGGKN